MKNLITFLLYCLSVTAMIGQGLSQTKLTVSSNDPAETIIQLNLNGVERSKVATPDGDAFIIHIDQGKPMLEAGKPDLPKMAATLMIPNTGNMAVEVLDAEYQDFSDVAVAPSKGNLLRTTDPSKVPYKYGETYQKDAFYPGKTADLQSPFILRDVRGQALWIYPVQYNPVQKVLRVYSSLRLRVYNEGGTGANELRRNAGAKSGSAFMQLYQKLFCNFQAALVGGERSAKEPEKMLVIAKDELIPDLKTFVDWKRKSGIQTTVIPASETGAGSADLYNFVKNYYTEQRITYLLLVGDEYTLQPMVRAGSNYSCDNCLGYQEGDDHFPEIFVGRFHASNAAQLAVMVNRQLEYETNPLIDPAANWCATGMASCSDQGAGIGDDNQADYEQGNEWKAKQLADGFEKYWEFYDGSHADISPTPNDETADKPGDPANTSLVNVMNDRGVSLYNYTGHGWEQGLASGNFSTDAVAQLRNTHRYPIVIAVACCAGNFTNNGGGDCLGEALQRAGDPGTGTPWGGIAGFFSSDFQSWSPPMEGQDGMNQYLVDADGVTLTPHLGGMAAFGNALMIAAYGQGGIDMADVWNPFCDPSTMPRTALPKQLTAVHPAQFLPGQSSMTVECPVEGALVSLVQNENVIAVATVEAGFALLQFPAITSSDDVSITVTQFNHVPYQGNMTAGSVQEAFVTNQGFSIYDASLGNNNGVADFGETVSLGITLANLGAATATDVQATLSTTDDRVTILNAEALFGELPAGQPTENGSAFKFSVADDIPDGYNVQFNLHVVYNGNKTNDFTLPVKLNAPELSVGTYTVTDYPNGDNDKRFESGEKITFMVQNLNTGHALSPNATGTLSSDSPWLTINGPFAVGPITTSNAANALFQIIVAPGAPAVTPATLTYKVTAGNYTAEKNLGTFIINPVVEDFESQTFQSYPWTMSGNKPWQILSGNAYTGNYCARSGSIGNNQKSQMDLTLDFSKDGNISFARRVSCEESFDFLRFYIDDVEIEHWTGNVVWGEVSFPITAGVHKLSWVYTKDEFGSDGSDRAWVDEISMPPYQIVVPTHTPVQEDFKVRVTPNPASDKTWLAVDLPEAQSLQVDLYDCTGHLSRSYEALGALLSGSYNIDLDLSGITPGMYFLHVRSDKTSKVLKVVKGN